METKKIKAAEGECNRVTVGESEIDLGDIYAVATGAAKIDISSNPEFVKKIEHSRKLLMNALEKGFPVYGVTTGFGKSCSKRLSMKTALDNGDHLLRFHGCGTGFIPRSSAPSRMRDRPI